MRLKTQVWTLVEHSGLPVGVEEMLVRTEGERARVVKAGGVLLDTYTQASEREYAENYPDENGGLYPRPTGTFARARLGSQRIYIPRQSTSTS